MARMAVIMVAATTVASFLGGLYYLFDVLSTFRPLIALAASGLAVVAWLLRRHRLGLVSAALCVIGVAGMILPDAEPVSQPATPVRLLTVVSFNAWKNNRQMGDVERYLKQTNPDIIVFQEFGRGTLALREALKRSHPWQFDCQHMAQCDIAIYSRTAWTRTGAFASSGTRPALAWATFGAGDAAFTVAGAHFTHPTDRRQLRQVETLAAWVAGRPNPVILAGDFNSAPWSHAMTRLRRKAGIRILSGIRPSWPATLGLAVLPIDHILVSPGIANLGVERGPFLGSDHLPIIARLGLPR